MAIRNWLYDMGWMPAETFAVPLLNVGNLRVGGTGKTPHVIWLVEELLRQGHRPAILSRGYARHTRGPRLAGPADSAATVGDEPWQYYGAFVARQVPVAVAEARRLGVALLLREHPEITVVVLDDAYQHRAVHSALNILLTELARPFYADHVLPAGRLRESRAGAARADVVIVTKCLPGLPEVTRVEAERQVRLYTRPGVPVLFSSYEYAPPQQLAESEPASQVADAIPEDINVTVGAKETKGIVGEPKYSAGRTPNSVSASAETGLRRPDGATPALLLTGIAQPGPLLGYLTEQGYHIHFHTEFPDHHAFSAADLTTLRAHWQPGWPIFTTEKDATRLLDPALRAARAGLPIYTIPVRVAFLGDDGAVLRQLLPAAPHAGH